jgi:tetratricopeptide (TPR) repeat protein
MESAGMLRHLPFFEELAQLDESDAGWRAVSAGLVVLRLFDTWVEDGPAVVAADSWSLSAVLSAIDEIPTNSPLRGVLRGVVDAMANTRKVDLHAVTPRLFAYGQTLEYDSRWTLAADVYQTIVAHAHPIEDSDIVVPGQIRRAECLRSNGDLGAALAEFERASQVANAAGDMMGVLRARIGDARIAIARGNMPHAERILDDTIARADGPALQDLRSRALHERAHVAGLREQYDRAIQFAYEALDLAASPRDRDRILGDIATAFMLLGMYDTARDAYLVLLASAQEQYVRWTAGLNLMDIAAREGAQPVFDRYRREFERETLPPYLRAEYCLIVGKGYQRFGYAEMATPMLNEAIEIAARHELNQVVFEAEEVLSTTVVAQRRAVNAAPYEVSPEVAGVAAAIRKMKVEVGVG